MSVLKYFKNTPRSPPHRATGLKCNFFLQIRNEVPGEKRPCRLPNGRQGPVAHPWGDRGLYMPPFPLSFEPAICRHSLCHWSLKIQEKREGWEEEKRRSSAELRTFWNGGRALLLGHVCLGKECHIWETRDRRAEQWQPVISYSQLDTLWFLFWAIRACHEVYTVCGSRHHRRWDLGR